MKKRSIKIKRIGWHDGIISFEKLPNKELYSQTAFLWHSTHNREQHIAYFINEFIFFPIHNLIIEFFDPIV